MNDSSTRQQPQTNTEVPLELAPERFRALGHELVEQIADFLASLPDRPAAPDVTPKQIHKLLGAAALPERGSDPREILQRACDLLFANNRLNGHPRSWGYIVGSPAPIGMLADLLAAAVNPNVVSWTGAPMAVEIELQVIRWIAQLLGYPGESGGLLVSGGTMANFVGVLAARRAKAPWDVRKSGLNHDAARPLRLYASDETHTWLQKAADLFGLGTDAIRWIPTDSSLRMRPDALEKRVTEDRARGDFPFLVVATAGTVATGAVDPLPALAAIARDHDLWFHVDGAYGAPAVAVANSSDDLCGIRQADSLAVDGHKWLFVPLEAGCVLVRDPQALHDAFSYRPSYYRFYSNDGEEPVNFHEYGPQNSRGFRALKLWAALQTAGRQGYASMLQNNIELAAKLARLLATAPDFEVCTQSLSITTFRYVPADLALDDPATTPYLDRLNEALMERIQRSGEAYLSNAVVADRYLLRTCITNFRSTETDIEMLPGIVRRHGQALDQEMRAKT